MVPGLAKKVSKLESQVRGMLKKCDVESIDGKIFDVGATASTLQLLGLFLLMGDKWGEFIFDVTGNRKNADKVTEVLKYKAQQICESAVKTPGSAPMEPIVEPTPTPPKPGNSQVTMVVAFGALAILMGLLFKFVL